MLNAKELTIVYETLLAAPGMSDTVKVSLHLPRKQALFLSKVIEAGMNVRIEEGKGSVLGMMDESTKEELAGFSGELLKKAGLTDLNEKINALAK